MPRLGEILIDEDKYQELIGIAKNDPDTKALLQHMAEGKSIHNIAGEIKQKLEGVEDPALKAALEFGCLAEASKRLNELAQGNNKLQNLAKLLSVVTGPANEKLMKEYSNLFSERVLMNSLRNVNKGIDKLDQPNLNDAAKQECVISIQAQITQLNNLVERHPRDETRQEAKNMLELYAKNVDLRANGIQFKAQSAPGRLESNSPAAAAAAAPVASPPRSFTSMFLGSQRARSQSDTTQGKSSNAPEILKERSSTPIQKR